MPWVRVAKTSDIQEGQIRTFAVGSKKIAVAHVGKAFFAVDDTCTHLQCSLGGGTVSNGEVECPCHGARFDLATGEVRALPAPISIQAYKVKVGGEELFVEI